MSDENQVRYRASHYRANFTIDEGLALQAKNLSEWKKKLNRKTYQALESWCQLENAKLDESCSGFDVVRGQSLSTFVHNL